MPFNFNRLPKELFGIGFLKIQNKNGATLFYNTFTFNKF